MTLSPSKKLALIVSVCILGVLALTANAHSMVECCVQAEGHNRYEGSKSISYVFAPDCCDSIGSSPCYLTPNNPLQFKALAVSSSLREQNSPEGNPGVTAAATLFPFYARRDTARPSQVSAPGLDIPLYLQNLSFLI